MAEKNNNSEAKVLSNSLSVAISKILDNNKSPSRKVNEIDNRSTNFYLILYWVEELSIYDDSFVEIYENLKKNENIIIDELNRYQGIENKLDGYWKFDSESINNFMCPSLTLNNLIK